MLSTIILSAAGEIAISLSADVAKKKLKEHISSIKWNKLFIQAKADLVKSFENDNDTISNIEFILNDAALRILSKKYENFKDLELVSSLREDLENLFRNNSNQNNVDELINRFIEALLFYIRRDYSELYSNIIIYQELEKIGDQIKLLNEKDKEVKISTCTLWQIEDALRKSNSYSIDLDFFDFQEQQIDNDIISSLNNKSIIYIKGENQEESLYYFLRLCKNDVQLCDSVFIIKDKESWDAVDKIFHGKILIPIFEADQIIPAQNSQTVLILPTNNCLYDSKCITIPKRSVNNICNSLSKYIADKNFIDRLIKNNVTNYQSLRNHLLDGVLMDPTWYTNVESPSIFIPALLLGKWDENKADKIVLGYIANEEYENYLLKLNELTKKGDKFIDCYRSFGSKIYYVVDLKTAWNILFKYIVESDYKNFISIFREIVIDQESRIESGIRQINCGMFSDKLKNGIVISLVYISITDKEKDFRYKVVNKCLDSIFKFNIELDEAQWQTVCNILSILVEAEPNYIISFLSKEFKNKKSKIHTLFNIKTDSLYSYASYPYLLFAIEKALFYKETCASSIRLLQDLCNKPIQSNMVNSPINTLSKVFCPFFDEIGLGIENRKQLLNRFMVNDKENCWKLLTEILPSRLGGTYDFLQKPYYRVSKYNREPFSSNETNKHYKAYLDIALNCAGRDLIKYGFMLQNTLFINLGYMKPYIDAVSPLLYDISVSDVEKYQFSIIVRRFIYDCRFYKHGWYNEEIVKQFEENIYNKIIYSNPVFYALYSFESSYLPLNPEIFIDDQQKYASQWQRNEKAQEDEQVKILSAYYKESIDKLAILFKYVEDNQQIGISLAKSLDYDLSKEIINILESNSKNTILYLYVYTVINSMESKDAIERIRDTLSDCSIETRFIALKSLRVDSNILEYINSLSDSDQNYYYKYINPCFKDLSREDIKKYFDNLLKADNYEGIRSFIINNELDTDDYIELLWNYQVYKQKNKTSPLREYEIIRIFKKIYKDKSISGNIVDKIIDLEISYAKIFYFSYDKPKPLYLMKKLSTDASYIVNIIKLTYLEDEGKRLEYSKREEELIQFYDQVIRYVHFCPCVDVDGVYHADKYTTWIENYESGINENNQKNIGLRLLGKFFAFFPKGKFPGWLPEEICNTIDTYNNDGLNDSFFIQCLNNRSVHYCNDGNENNLLIEEYKKYAEIYEFSYPITASIFRKLSDYYNDEKQEQKERASHSIF